MTYAITNANGHRWTRNVCVYAKRNRLFLARAGANKHEVLATVLFKNERIHCIKGARNVICATSIDGAFETVAAACKCDFCVISSDAVLEALTADAIVGITYALLALLLNADSQLITFLQMLNVDIRYETSIAEIISRVICECAYEEGAEEACSVGIKIFWDRLKRYKWQKLFETAHFSFGNDYSVLLLLNMYFQMRAVIASQNQRFRFSFPINLPFFTKNIALTARIREFRKMVLQ